MSRRVVPAGDSGGLRRIGRRLTVAMALVLPLAPAAVRAQALDLSNGGPIQVTAEDGIEWRQAEQQVIARGQARAVRGNVTVTADRLIAWYRKKAADDGTKPAAAPASAGGIAAETDTAGNEVYRLQAEGHVVIFTDTDQATGARATYDIDQAVLVMTGQNLKLTTPNEILTARDSLEYWAQKHMAVARGDAVVLTKDGHRLAADTLVAYTAAAPADAAPAPARQASTGAAASGSADDPLSQQSGKLEKVEAFGHVSVRTATDIVTGDRGVYVPDTGIARLGGNVRITRGNNQLNGAEADVNMKTGVARLTSSGASRVQGLVVPGEKTDAELMAPPNVGQPNAAPASSAGGKR